MVRSLLVVAIGCVVGGIVIVQDAVPWPVTPEQLIHKRAPLSIGGEWEGRLVRLYGMTIGKMSHEENLDGRQGAFKPVMEDGTVLLFAAKAGELGGNISIKSTGRVTRAPEEVVARFKGLEFPGRICVDATAPRATWRSLVGLAVILWGFYILFRGVRRERAKKRAEAASSAENPGE